ncbi:MAG TPA: hypothetical protein VGQ12_08485, partial [Candidatus Angelobacter sp.]|nr:hypothetical protein [Candidatus Angelobacter sp.]
SDYIGFTLCSFVSFVVERFVFNFGISAIMAITLYPTPSFLIFVANKDTSTNRRLGLPWVTLG